MARDQSDVHAFRAAGDFDARLMELRLLWRGDDGQPASMSEAIREAVDFAWRHLVKDEPLGQTKSHGPSWKQSWWSGEDRTTRPDRRNPARCRRCGEVGFNCWC
jgi:hypothetical protein